MHDRGVRDSEMFGRGRVTRTVRKRATNRTPADLRRASATVSSLASRLSERSGSTGVPQPAGELVDHQSRRNAGTVNRAADRAGAGLIR